MKYIKAWVYNFFVAPFVGEVIDQMLKVHLKQYYKNQQDNHQEMMKIQLENQDIVSRAFRGKDDGEEKVEQRHKELIDSLKDISNAIGQAK